MGSFLIFQMIITTKNNKIKGEQMLKNCISLKEFKMLSKEGNLIPVYKEILADLDTPLSAFLKLNGEIGFLFESVEGGKSWARFSFLGSNPFLTIKGKGNTIIIKQGCQEKKIKLRGSPLEAISKMLKKYKPVITPDLPRFFGGFVGYIGYDTVRHFEKLPDNNLMGTEHPDLFLMLTDTLLVFDNLTKKIKVIANAYIRDKKPEEAYKGAVEKIDKIVDKLKSKLSLPKNSAKNHLHKTDFSSNFTKAGFKKAVDEAKKYVTSGDVIQVVLSQNFKRPTRVNPIDAYRALRVINPSPYMFYFNTGEATLVGSSPEALVRIESDIIELRPIAGTRKRGKTPEDDLLMEEELRDDPKERAEHIMLVDLARNDAGKVAKTGTVEVRNLMGVEKYSHVMHLVTSVTGKLNKKHSAYDILKATFPAGTVTGAPKIRAMEIIEELEPSRRGPYAGCVGYFDFSGNMDVCITIRTIIFKNGNASIQAGAGIVADSDPEKEYKETINKAKGMFAAIEMAENGLSIIS
jgi:anthranilate synthase component 1